MGESSLQLGCSCRALPKLIRFEFCFASKQMSSLSHKPGSLPVTGMFRGWPDKKDSGLHNLLQMRKVKSATARQGDFRDRRAPSLVHPSGKRVHSHRGSAVSRLPRPPTTPPTARRRSRTISWPTLWRRFNSPLACTCEHSIVILQDYSSLYWKFR